MRIRETVLIIGTRSIQENAVWAAPMGRRGNRHRYRYRRYDRKSNHKWIMQQGETIRPYQRSIGRAARKDAWLSQLFYVSPQNRRITHVSTFGRAWLGMPRRIQRGRMPMARRSILPLRQIANLGTDTVVFHRACQPAAEHACDA